MFLIFFFQIRNLFTSIESGAEDVLGRKRKSKKAKKKFKHRKKYKYKVKKI